MGNTRVCGSCFTAEVCLINKLLEKVEAVGSIRCRHYRENNGQQGNAPRARTPEDINLVSRELKKLYEEPDKDEKELPMKEERAVCGICGKCFPLGESEICGDCGRIICPDCTVFSADGSGVLCEDCYS